ncbi:MAG: DUF2007 domain-containing protein [Phycisphaerae bacterium]
MEEKNIVKVFGPETEWQGELIVQHLKDAGIEAYLANRSTAAVWGDVSPLGDLEILVPEDQEPRAREIIQEFLSSHGVLPAEQDVPEDDADKKK